jgi:glutamate carboxypeptidase
MLEDVERLVRAESPSADPALLAACADEIADLGRRLLGVAPDAVETGGRRHLRFRVGPQPPRVLVLTHYDTVWPRGSWERVWSVADGVAAGPGVFDMKSGLVMALHALAAVDWTGAAGGATLLCTADEETGSATSRALIEAEAAGMRAVFVTEAPTREGALKVARKGASTFRLTARGRAAHAGLEPEKGVNAAVELAHQIPRIAALTGNGTTVVPTVVQAGTTTNTVPAAASVAVDVRVWTQAEFERVQRGLAALEPVLAGAALETELLGARAPFERSAAEALFALAQELGRPLGLDLAAAAVGGASDGNFTAGLGIPTLDGLGAAGGGAHGPDEHILVESLAPRTQLLAALIGHTVHEGSPE